MASMKNNRTSVESVAASILEDIKKDPVLLACKSFVELHEHCDANTLGCQEELFEAVGLQNALPILNDAQHEVNLWLVANSIECQPHWLPVDMDVESLSAAFKIKHGRRGNCEKDEALFDEMWFDDVYLKIRAMVRERTGK